MVNRLLGGSTYSNYICNNSDGKKKLIRSYSRKKLRVSRKMRSSKHRKSKHKKSSKNRCADINFRYKPSIIRSAKRKCKSRLGINSCVSDPNCDWDDAKNCNGKFNLSLSGVYYGPSLPVK